MCTGCRVVQCSVTIMKIEPLLAEVGELLAVPIIRLRSATVEEMPALIDEAN
jgi:hypothetical protein